MLVQPQTAGNETRTRKQRARLVCMRCHDKKIKCDLQTSSGQIQTRCSGCVDAFAECRFRPSQRSNVRRRNSKALPSPLGNSAGSAVGFEAITRVASLSNPESAGVVSADSGLRSCNIYGRHDQSSQPLPLGQLHEPIFERGTHLPASSQSTTASGGTSLRTAYLGQSGFMSIFSQDPGEDDTANFQVDAQEQHLPQLTPVLQESYLDTYMEYCYTWCPILDRVSMKACSEFRTSQLLREALALVGSQLNPPLIPHPKPEEHFKRFRQLFYDNREGQPLIRICAVMLLYWWSSGPPNVVNIDTNWWWMGAAIRLAQEIGLHREQHAEHMLRPGETDGLQRRVWWTLFSRERLTALMQGRPCAIDPAYCDLRMASVDDFPDPNDPKAAIFVQWVKLCEIIGRVGKAIAQGNIHDQDSMPARDLMNWPQALPDHLQLPIANDRTTNFNRDVHLLHLPYLATTILLHLQKTSEKLPRASMTAIIAASCISRIFQDILGRGNSRCLPGQSGWYISISILALLYARKIEALTTHADADIAILLTALKRLSLLWHSSKMFFAGFRRILESENINIIPSGLNNNPALEPPFFNDHTQTSPTLMNATMTADTTWRVQLPYVTANTSPLIAALLEDIAKVPYAQFELSQANFLFDFLDDFDFSIL